MKYRFASKEKENDVYELIDKNNTLTISH